MRDETRAFIALRAKKAVAGCEMNRVRRLRVGAQKLLAPGCALEREHVCRIRYHLRVASGGDSPVLIDRGNYRTGAEWADGRESKWLKLLRQV